MKNNPAFDEFVETIARLRAPDGCPWDREQTHLSIARNMIEEAYEAVDAIESGDINHLREELGDVLLQVVLQSLIAQDAGEFTLDEVCRDINEKMIRRHPHVFGEAEAESAGDVVALWDAVKLDERINRATSAAVSVESAALGEPATLVTTTPAAPAAPSTSTAPAVLAAPTTPTTPTAPPTSATPPATRHTPLLDGIPTNLPALMQAQKISRKAVSAGFEWETLDDVWAQVFSEIDELKEAYAAAPKDAKGKVSEGDNVELEMGDVLFTLVNVARKMGIDAESALRAGCKKFRSRWAFIEGAAWAQGKEPEQLTFDEMEEYWTQAKQINRAP